ncbi:DUF1016 N-terminal domain-containing protein [Pinibacter soli]|uniref:DUF1016 N-terminal domain-containing protein n=1 Tax=Pinibacter soli TaxID=3044211 RepID=A0ABT6RIY0_9BACT|nr:DUF1016 N-terminal domain-containing protein [Pinibacter soli]MDI3322527.1 DUF1016 N-terminal domain-containing protein [Pinibacter soli]
MKIEMTNNYSYSDQTSFFVRDRKVDLVRLANYEMMLLFWKVGSKIDEYLSANLTDSHQQIKYLSTWLSQHYGKSFSFSNLQKMVRFATQFENLEIEQFISFISWSHLLFILDVDDIEDKLFHIKETVQQNLSVEELEKRIKEAALKKISTPENNLFKALKNKTFTALLTTRTRAEYYSHERNHLRTDLIRQLNLYSQLLLTNRNSSKKATPTDSQERFINSLYEMIDEHIYHGNQRMNSHMNLSFWQLGKKLVNLTDTKGSLPLNEIMSNLRQTHGKLFTKKNILKMIEFAQVVPDSTTAMQIAKNARWDQILFLLTEITDPNKLVFYAFCISEEGLSKSALKEKISSNAFDHASEALRSIAELAKKETTVERKSTRKGNSVFNIDTIYIPVKYGACNKLIVKNIVKQLYFRQFAEL